MSIKGFGNFILIGLAMIGGTAYGHSPDPASSGGVSLSTDGSAPLSEPVSESVEGPLPEPLPKVVTEAKTEAGATPTVPASDKTVKATAVKKSGAASLQKTKKADNVKKPVPQVVLNPGVLGPRDFWFWFGGSANYNDFQQADANQLNFKLMSVPSVFARAGFYMNPRLGFEMNYRHTPGKVKSSDAIFVENGTSLATTFTSELLVRMGDGKLRAGVQRQALPYLALTPSNAVSIEEAVITLALIGADYSFFFRGFRLDTGLQYQHPTAATANGESATVNAKYAVAGHVGAVRDLGRDWRFGAYSSTQYQSFDINAANFKVLNLDIELRVGMEF